MKKNRPRLHFTALFALAGAGLLTCDVSVGLAQQGRSRHDEPVDVVLARVPEKARGKQNPFEGDPDAIAAGEKLFEQHCAECHGGAADGAKRGPSLRTGKLQQATAGEIFWILTNGVVRRGMPAWSKLPEPQRWQIIAFLRELDGLPGGGANDPIHTAKDHLDVQNALGRASGCPSPSVWRVRVHFSGPGSIFASGPPVEPDLALSRLAMQSFAGASSR